VQPYVAEYWTEICHRRARYSIRL